MQRIAILLFFILLVVPRFASADSLVNGGFDLIGSNGSQVTTSAMEAKESAALGWSQWAGVGYLITELLPTTDPLGGSGYMIHVNTNDGMNLIYYFGNGIGQMIVAPQ